MEESRSIHWESTACPLCGADDSRVFLRAPDRLYRRPGPFTLVRCAECGHFFLNPRPTVESVRFFYPEEYGPHHLDGAETQTTISPGGGADRSGRPWYLAPWLRTLPGIRWWYYWLKETWAELIPDLGHGRGRALELGCADGRFLERLRQQGWEARGIELVERPALVARNKGFDVHVGTLEPGMFPEGCFDAVFAWMVVEHLHEPKEVVGEIRRILKESGWLVMSVPNFACWEPSLFRTYWYSLQLPTHLHQFTPRTLRTLLRQCGFPHVRIIHQQNVFNLVGSVGLWLREAFPKLALGPKLLRFTDDPTMWGQLVLAPLAKLLAWCRQGGRLTVLARAEPIPRTIPRRWCTTCQGGPKPEHAKTQA